jgi:hypothetical protein
MAQGGDERSANAVLGNGPVLSPVPTLEQKRGWY